MSDKKPRSHHVVRTFISPTGRAIIAYGSGTSEDAAIRNAAQNVKRRHPSFDPAHSLPTTPDAFESAMARATPDTKRTT